MDLHVDDTCTKCLPCGASGRMHESNEGRPSDSLSSKLTDGVVNMVKNRGRGKRKNKNTSRQWEEVVDGAPAEQTNRATSKMPWS